MSSVSSLMQGECKAAQILKLHESFQRHVNDAHEYSGREKMLFLSFFWQSVSELDAIVTFVLLILLQALMWTQLPVYLRLYPSGNKPILSHDQLLKCIYS